MARVIKQGTVYTIDNNIKEIYSSFEKAESALLDKIRCYKINVGFINNIVTVAVNVGILCETSYIGNVKINGNFKHIYIKRDEHNKRGLTKIYKEKLKINLVSLN